MTHIAVYFTYWNNTDSVYYDISVKVKCSHTLHWHAVLELARPLPIYIYLERTDIVGNSFKLF